MMTQFYLIMENSRKIQIKSWKIDKNDDLLPLFFLYFSKFLQIIQLSQFSSFHNLTQIACVIWT